MSQNHQVVKNQRTVASVSDFLSFEKDGCESTIAVFALGQKLFGEVDNCIVSLKEHENQKSKVGKVEIPADFWDTERFRSSVMQKSDSPQAKGVIRLIKEIGTQAQCAGSDSSVLGRFNEWFKDIKTDSELISLKDVVFLYCYQEKDPLVIDDVLTYKWAEGMVWKASIHVPINGSFVKIEAGQHRVSKLSRIARTNSTRFENPDCLLVFFISGEGILEGIQKQFPNMILLRHHDDGVMSVVDHYRMYEQGSTFTVTPRNRPGSPVKTITIASCVADFVFSAMTNFKWRIQGKGSLRLKQRTVSPLGAIFDEIKRLGKVRAPEFSSTVALFNEAIRLMIHPDMHDCEGLKFGTGLNAGKPTHLVSWAEMNTDKAHASGLFMDEFGYQMILRAGRFRMRRLHPSLAAFYAVCSTGLVKTPVSYGLCLEPSLDTYEVKFICDEKKGLQSSSQVLLDWFSEDGKFSLGEIDPRKIQTSKAEYRLPEQPKNEGEAVRRMQREVEQLKRELAVAKQNREREPKSVAYAKSYASKYSEDDDGEVVVIDRRVKGVAKAMRGRDFPHVDVISEALKEFETSNPVLTVGSDELKSGDVRGRNTRSIIKDKDIVTDVKPAVFGDKVGDWADMVDDDDYDDKHPQEPIPTEADMEDEIKKRKEMNTKKATGIDTKIFDL